LEHYFSRVFQKPPRLDVIKIYDSTRHYTAFKRGVDLLPNKRFFVATRVLVTRVLTTNVYETSLQLRFCTRESRNPRHHGLSMSNGETRTLGTTKFFEPLVASLQPCETLNQSSDLTALLQQFAFHSFVEFHVSFTILFILMFTILFK
ncbi:hypothetical protein ALC57_18437, partial [Trachymyrmex cornetzi]